MTVLPIRFSTDAFNRLLLALWVCLSVVIEVQAQADCGVVSSISYPVDRSVFQLAQDFGVPSPRHQGRYHTGEDYYGGRNSSVGQPVSAVADGRVTYSAPNGWGRDGGVVILEHTFPDGSVAYSMYGHMMNTDVYPFPERFACVRAGDVVGSVGDVRPAPHLHFEIRTTNPDTPGAGYVPDIPTQLGYLQPAKFVTNWQAWLDPAHRWHLQLPDDTRPAAPPLLLSDGSMLVLTADRIRYASADGRVLWRIILPAAAVGLTIYNGSPILIYADGIMQVINMDASLGESWRTGVAFDSPPLPVGDLLLFHTPDNGLAAVGADRRTVLWQIANVPPFVTATAAAAVIGLQSADHNLYTVSPDGRLLGIFSLEAESAMAAAPDGSLWVLAQNGVTAIDAAGAQSLVLNLPIAEAATAAITGTADGTRYLFTGGAAPALIAVNPQGDVLWQFAVEGMGGHAQLLRRDQLLLLLTANGDIMTVQAASGAVCSRLHIYGDRRARLWYDLGADGLLRVQVADQLIGLDWQTLQGACV